MTEGNGKAYSYVRFSSAEQRRGRSQQRQTELCRAYCAAHGLRLATEPEYTFLDAGRSAWKGDHLSEKGQLARFLGLVHEGIIEPGSTLIVESLDRLDRRNVSQAVARFIELLGAGIRVVTLKDERVYVDGNAEDLIFSIFIFARANDESSQKAKRLADVFESKRKKAAEALTPMGDVAPNWLKLNDAGTAFEPVPSKVAAVQRIFQLCIAGYGKNSIAKMLNEEKFPTLSDRESVKGWGTSAVHHVVMNRAVLGEWQPMTRTQDPQRKKRATAGPEIRDYFPRIIEEEVFLRAQNAIESRRTTKATKQSARFNVWQGVAKCLHCGSAMHMVNKGQPPRGTSYIDCSLGRKGLCTSHKLIRLDQSEEVFRLMLARLDMKALVMESAAKVSKSLSATEAQLSSAVSKLVDTKRLVAVTPSASGFEVLAHLDAEVARLTAERNRLFGELAAEGSISFETFMARLNLDDRSSRALANSLLKRHNVQVFASASGFVVAEAGRIRFGVGYDKTKRQAGYFDLSMWHPQRDGDAPHVAASKAMPERPVLYFNPPLEAGPLAYQREQDEAEARYEAMEDDGTPLTEAEFQALRHPVTD